MATHVLPDGVYYRLRWLQAEAERDQSRVLLCQAKAQESMRRYHQALADTGRAFDFDASQPCRWSDAECSLEPCGEDEALCRP